MRRNTIVFSLIGSLCLTAGVAEAADKTPGECHMVNVLVCTPKKMKRRKKPSLPAPAAVIVPDTAAPPPFVPPAEPPVCEKAPPPETKIVTVKEYVPVPVEAHPAASPEYLNIGLGVMGSALSTRHAWGWGPAIQIRARMAPHTEAVLDLGIAAGADGADWSPGQTRAWMAHLGVAHYLRPWFALTGGAFTEVIGAKPGWEAGTFVTGTAGFVLRKDVGPFTFRTELDAQLGGVSFPTNDNGVGFVYGALGMGIITYKWN